LLGLSAPLLRLKLVENEGIAEGQGVKKAATGFRPWPPWILLKTNKKATGGCAVAGVTSVSCNLPGDRRTPRINSHTTAEIGDANGILDVGVELCHWSCAPFL